MPLAHYEKKANGGPAQWRSGGPFRATPSKTLPQLLLPIVRGFARLWHFCQYPQKPPLRRMLVQIGNQAKGPLAPLNSSASPGGVVQTDASGAEPQVNHEP